LFLRRRLRSISSRSGAIKEQTSLTIADRVESAIREKIAFLAGAPGAGQQSQGFDRRRCEILSCGGKTPMSNPRHAILIQSKRFPLVWKELKTPLPTWQSLLPETQSPSEISPGSQDWVFKPVFGRVGEDIAIVGVTEQRAYKEIIKDVKRHPHDWIAQRRFDTLPLETCGGLRYACLGIFTLDGRAVGAYGQIASKPLNDHDAQDIAVLIRRKDHGKNDRKRTV